MAPRGVFGPQRGGPRGGSRRGPPGGSGGPKMAPDPILCTHSETFLPISLEHLSRLGELLNTLEKCTFLAPPGPPSGGPLKRAISASAAELALTGPTWPFSRFRRSSRYSATRAERSCLRHLSTSLRTTSGHYVSSFVHRSTVMIIIVD